MDTYPIAPTGFNWEIRRWEGSRFYTPDPAWDTRWESQVQLWETADGRLVGAVHPDGGSEVYLEIHPDYRHLEPDMIAWGEAHLAGPTRDGSQRQVHLFVYEYDALRLRLMRQLGYEKTPYWGVVRRMRFGGQPLPTPALADGYSLRTTRPADRDDCQQIADLLNAAFNRTFHCAEEFQTFTRMAPCYRNDLDLVAVAPDGTFAAYVGIPYDEGNRCGIYEPVCTHPEHRGRGLARALMFEGLRRLKALGAADVIVGTGDMEPANRLYESVGFPEIYTGYFWRRVF